jgi:hypothetical protein
VTAPTWTPTDLLWLAMTVYFEASGEPEQGQKAVVKVILNRAVRRRKTLKQIVLEPWQFSCWNSGLRGPLTNPLRPDLLAKIHETCIIGVQEWIDGARLRGATHFYAPKSMVPVGRVPSWVPSMTHIADMYGHKFYREGPEPEW